jgi:hypothetical protein
VGSSTFAERVSSELGDRTRYREVGAVEDAFVLREPAVSYGASLAVENGRIRIRPE